jgi:Phycobilisome degradation protein nblA
MMSQANNLSLEQQFQLILYRKKISLLSKLKSKQYLEIILRYMLIKDNIIKFLIKNKKF